LNDLEIRSEAGEILRGLIDRIEIAPAPIAKGDLGNAKPIPAANRKAQPSDVVIVLYGELATVIGLAEDNGSLENKGRFSLSAGARDQLYLLFVAASLSY